MITRRTLLQRSGKAAAAAVAAGMLPRCLRAMPLGLPAGIQLYAVRTSLQAHPAETLKQLHAIGYRQVEAAGAPGMSAEAFGKLIAAAGLQCPSAHVQFTQTDFTKGFADTHAVGAQYTVSSALAFAILPRRPRRPGVPFTPPPALSRDDFMKMADLMNRIGKAASADGLIYAYHNHNLEFVRMPDGKYGYDLLLTHTDPDTVKFEADCGWMTVAGADPVHYFHAYPGRYRMLHVKDFQPISHPTSQLGGPDRPQGIELGRGFVKYDRIFKAAKTAGIQHVFAEQEAPYTPNDMGAAEVDYKFLASFS